MPIVEGAGVALHYLSRGEGACVLLVHGMASDALAWEPALEALADAGLRAVALDRRGYGASGAPELYAATTVQEQAEDVAAVLESLCGSGGALLVGSGFGALVVLELLVRRGSLASGAVLAEPPLHAFVASATAALADERSLLESALREGGREAAVRAWLGEDVVAADPARAQRAVGSQRGFFADYAGQSSWSPSRRELRAIGVPVAVVTGSSTPPYVVEAADVVARLVPGATRVGDGDVVGAVVALAGAGG